MLVQHPDRASHLERVAGDLLGLATSARWAQLRDVVAGATRQVDLERIEDEVDAVLSGAHC